MIGKEDFSGGLQLVCRSLCPAISLRLIMEAFLLQTRGKIVERYLGDGAVVPLKSRDWKTFEADIDIASASQSDRIEHRSVRQNVGCNRSVIPLQWKFSSEEMTASSATAKEYSLK